MFEYFMEYFSRTDTLTIWLLLVALMGFSIKALPEDLKAIPYWHEIKKGLWTLWAILLFLALNALPYENSAPTESVVTTDQLATNIERDNEFIVDSRSGWQKIIFNQPVGRISSISGEWSVDDNRFTRVGPKGHYGNSATSLIPHNARKFDSDYAFGALLVGIEDQGYMHVTGPIDFKQPVKRIMARINDRDDSLGDNGGALIISFE